MFRIKEKVKGLVPFSARVEFNRARRVPADLKIYTRLSRAKGDPSDFSFLLSESISPLERIKGSTPRTLQKGKEKNVQIASGLIDRVIIKPGMVFSYHHLVGRPSRLRRFRRGLELRDGRVSAGIGGGCCQVSNMLYWLALNSGMNIIERHRHAFDLFPDVDRKIPFGCGATVFYNYRDFRFENPLIVPVMVCLHIKEGELIGRIFAAGDPGYSFLIEERDHRFFKDDGYRMRENRIYRKIISQDGIQIREELLAHNRCRVMY